MNLYDYHTMPESLARYKDREDIVPGIVKSLIIHQFPLNKKQMEVIKRNPHLALDYAIHRVRSRWPEGEDIIMTNSTVADSYEVFLSEIGYNDSWEDDEDKPRGYKQYRHRTP